jgi:transcriptional regulator with XRE-family HTH domain
MKRKKSLDTILIEIGEGLTHLREKKGFDTLTNFAIRYDLPPNQYWKIENGKANMTIKTLLKLLAIHGITVEEFFCFLREYR